MNILQKSDSIDLDKPPKNIIILGSTGSIGTQTINVIEKFPRMFNVIGLAAGGNKIDLFQEQKRKFPNAKTAIISESAPNWVDFKGISAIDNLLSEAKNIDVIVNSIEGISGIAATYTSLETDAILALANKESIVCSPNKIKKLSKENQIWPVDSEHSAVLQASRAGGKNEISKIILTASGGPFYGFDKKSLELVTPNQALVHPTWSMGNLISTHSATLVNKATEVLEANVLFDVDFSDIEVSVHRQSIVHSMISFTDGSTIAQASNPSMEIPIAYAISEGKRLKNLTKPIDFSKNHTWTFEPVDHKNFPAIKLAIEAAKISNLYTIVYISSAEMATKAFLDHKISFLQIYDCIDAALNNFSKSDLTEMSSDTFEEINIIMKWSSQFISKYIVDL